MKKNLFLIALASIMLVSCNNEKIMSENVEYEDMYKQLKLEKISNRLASVDSTMITRGNITSEIVDELDDQGYCFGLAIEIARPKKNCLSGFGFCRLIIGIDILKVIDAIREMLDKDDVYIGEIKKDSFGKVHMYIKLAEFPGMAQVPNFIMDNDVVGEEMQQEETEEVTKKINDYVILKQGIYEYDPTIGNYGGYSIDVELVPKRIQGEMNEK